MATWHDEDASTAKMPPALKTTAVELTERLCGLVEARVPVVIEGEDENAARSATLPLALIVRAAVTGRSLASLAPQHRELDAWVLARVLYEHVVLFAWLVIDLSEERFAAWRRTDLSNRLRMADEWETMMGSEVLSQADRNRMTSRHAKLESSLPRTLQLAEQADKYWRSRLCLAVDEHVATFRGLYTAIYRRGSAYAHPSIFGLQTFRSKAGKKDISVHIEHPNTGHPWVYGAWALGLGVYICSFSFQWPGFDEVVATLESYARQLGPPASG